MMMYSSPIINYKLMHLIVLLSIMIIHLGVMKVCLSIMIKIIKVANTNIMIYFLKCPLNKFKNYDDTCNYLGNMCQHFIAFCARFCACLLCAACINCDISTVSMKDYFA